MKKHLYCICVFTMSLFAWHLCRASIPEGLEIPPGYSDVGDLLDEYLGYTRLQNIDFESTVPQLVRFCDVAGVGKITGHEWEPDPERVTIEVMDYWYGGLPTNTVTLYKARTGKGLHQGLSNGVACVFLAYTNLWHEEKAASKSQKLTWDYMTHRESTQPPVGTTNRLMFYSGRVYSIFPADVDGGRMAQWTFNLVQCVKVNPDEDTFMSVLYEWPPHKVSIWSAEELNVSHFFSYMAEAETKEKLLKWRNNPKLPEALRKSAESQLNDKFKWTPSPSDVPEQ